jgi:hypothetical protein
MKPSLRLVLAVAAASFPLIACAGRSGAKSASGSHESPAERSAKVKRWLARELDPAQTRQVSLFDGAVAGEIESKTEIRPECQNTDSGSLCSVIADFGPDQDDPEMTSNIVCSVSASVRAFGPMLKATSLEKAQLDETPVLEVKQAGEGLSAKFVANTTEQEGDNVLVGTAKFAALYAHGYMAVCFDKRAGGRKTFDRVTGHFFESLKLKSTVTVFATGYQMRMGDRTSGVKYSSIAKRPGDDAGFVESSAYFHLDTDGKTWSMKDLYVVAERDAKGTLQKMEYLFWSDGEGPAVLSAKPSEDKKFRLKFELGDKSNGLESTPKAPLNTELWAAPELARVSAGTAQTYRYAFLDIVDSDPAFRYLTITRSAPRVLAEVQEELPAAGGEKPSGPPSKDELQVDARGIVTKEVSSQSVTELVHTWGNLPAVLGGAKEVASKPAKPKKGS